jgi:hypothetical protein
MYHHPPYSPHPYGAQRNAQARRRAGCKRRRYDSDAAQVNKRFKPLVDSHHTTHQPPTPPYPHGAERDALDRRRAGCKRKRYESDTELNTRIYRERIEPLVESCEAEYDPFAPEINSHKPRNQWMRALIRAAKHGSHDCVQRCDDYGLLARIAAYRQSGWVDRAVFVQAERTAAFLRNTARGPRGALPVA